MKFLKRQPSRKYSSVPWRRQRTLGTTKFQAVLKLLKRQPSRSYSSVPWQRTLGATKFSAVLKSAYKTGSLHKTAHQYPEILSENVRDSLHLGYKSWCSSPTTLTAKMPETPEAICGNGSYNRGTICGAWFLSHSPSQSQWSFRLAPLRLYSGSTQAGRTDGISSDRSGNPSDKLHAAPANCGSSVWSATSLFFRVA